VQQIPPQADSAGAQAPLQQSLPAARRFPQRPQLAGSLLNAVAGSTQRSPQAWSPARQMQRLRPV